MADVLIRKQLSGFNIFLLEFSRIALDFGEGSIYCLLGRDVLALCSFTYNGPDRSFALSF
jgi:hypothetical protein